MTLVPSCAESLNPEVCRCAFLDYNSQNSPSWCVSVQLEIGGVINKFKGNWAGNVHENKWVGQFRCLKKHSGSVMVVLWADIQCPVHKRGSPKLSRADRSHFAGSRYILLPTEVGRKAQSRDFPLLQLQNCRLCEPRTPTQTWQESCPRKCTHV